jgi:dynein heavy chain
MEEWLKFQKTWMYLSPIFTSEDIMFQMPIEGKKFQRIDLVWRSTMESVFKEPQVSDVMDRQNMDKQFLEANNDLDDILKGLNDYLDYKRLAFPRF